MPIPNPQPNENENEFISRCTDFLVNEGTEQEQAVAICYTEWENGKTLLQTSKIEPKMKNEHDIQAAYESKKNNHYSVKGEGSNIVKDVDFNKRIVTGFFNSYNFMDSDADVLQLGSAKKSIKERGADSQTTAKIKHALFHDLTRLPAKILVLEEREINGITGIYFESKMLNTREGNDTLINYQEGVYDNHSIGFKYENVEYLEAGTDKFKKVRDTLVNPELAEQTGYLWLVKEIKLYEGSTVSFGANSLTPYLGSKNMTKDTLTLRINEKIDLLTKQLQNGKQTDEQLYMFELQTQQLKQMIFELNNLKPTAKQSTQNEPLIIVDTLTGTDIKNLFKTVKENGESRNFNSFKS